MRSMKASGNYIKIHGMNKLFPFFMGETKGVSESSRILHWHDDLEICYIKQGTGKYIINGYVYDYEAGDVFLINNDEIHLAYDDRNLIIQVMMFDPSILWADNPSVMDYEYLTPFLDAGIKYGHKLCHNHEHIDMVIDIIMEIQKEYEMKPQRYELMIKSLLLKLMTVIMRYFRANAAGEAQQKVNPMHSQKLKYAVEYLDENLDKTICFKEIANLLGISVSHFYKLFKKYSGIPPMEYLIRRRVCAAKRLLKSTDKKIMEIAGECGFNSISSFNKNFIAFVGASPREYRKETFYNEEL